MRVKKDLLSKIDEGIARLKHVGDESDVLGAPDEIRRDSCCILMSKQFYDSLKSRFYSPQQTKLFAEANLYRTNHWVYRFGCTAADMQEFFKYFQFANTRELYDYFVRWMQRGPRDEITSPQKSNFSTFLRLTLRTAFSPVDMLDAAYTDMLEIHRLIK